MEMTNTLNTNHSAKPDQGQIFIIPGLAWNNHLIPIRD